MKASRLPAFAAVVEARDGCILEMLDRPRTLAELTAASPIYGGRAYAPGILDSREGQMIGRHLERRGRVAREEPAATSSRAAAAGAGGAEPAVEPTGFDDRSRWTRR